MVRIGEWILSIHQLGVGVDPTIEWGLNDHLIPLQATRTIIRVKDH